ncbi:MAG: phosphatase PAP2 family protein [Zetaproteobacteria bacterium]|nr:MAG: phosphatase PAP2 family protein [Zetaproteobacteria bacterium]
METHALFRLINDAHSPWADACFGLISGLGDGLVVALLCALLMMVRLRLGMAAMAAFIASGLITQALKHLIAAPRPPAVLQDVHVLGDVLYGHSFPSGHATSDGVMAASMFLLWGLKSWRAWLGGLLFMLAALGRVYGGVHFPLDVGVGFVLGCIVMIVCWRAVFCWVPVRWEHHEWAWKASTMLVALLAAVLGLGYRIQPATAGALGLVLPVLALAFVARTWKVKHERKG